MNSHEGPDLADTGIFAFSPSIKGWETPLNSGVDSGSTRVDCVRSKLINVYKAVYLG